MSEWTIESARDAIKRGPDPNRYGLWREAASFIEGYELAEKKYRGLVEAAKRARVYLHECACQPETTDEDGNKHDAYECMFCQLGVVIADLERTKEAKGG